MVNRFFVVQMDTAGGVLWATAGIPLSLSRPYVSIAADSLGNAFVAGNFDSASVSFGTASLVKPAGDTTDVFLAKYDPSGHCEWAQTAVGTDIDFATGVATDRQGSIYMAGFYRSPTLSFQTTTLHNSATDTFYHFNFFVTRYTESGDVDWALTSTDTNYTQASCLATCSQSGAMYIGGNFAGEPFLNLGADTVFGYSTGIAPSIGFWARLDDLTDVRTVAGPAGTIKLYPDPTSGTCTLESPNAPINSVEVIDAVGRLVRPRTSGLHQSKVELTLQGVPDGHYLVRVVTDEGSQALPVVIVH
jgi:hypothetical protein